MVEKLFVCARENVEELEKLKAWKMWNRHDILKYKIIEGKSYRHW